MLSAPKFEKIDQQEIVAGSGGLRETLSGASATADAEPPVVQLVRSNIAFDMFRGIRGGVPLKFWLRRNRKLGEHGWTSIKTATD